MKKHSFSLRKNGFTMLEILLVVAAIGILAGIVIVAINPSKQIGDTRNAKRASNVATILDATYQYLIDNETLPSTISAGTTCPGVDQAEICQTDTLDCTGLVDLSVLTNGAKYLVAMPRDPSVAEDADGTGYRIFKTADDRITVCAPNTHDGDLSDNDMIEVTR